MASYLMIQGRCVPNKDAWVADIAWSEEWACRQQTRARLPTRKVDITSADTPNLKANMTVINSQQRMSTLSSTSKSHPSTNLSNNLSAMSLIFNCTAQITVSMMAYEQAAHGCLCRLLAGNIVPARALQAITWLPLGDKPHKTKRNIKRAESSRI